MSPAATRDRVLAAWPARYLHRTTAHASSLSEHHSLLILHKSSFYKTHNFASWTPSHGSKCDQQLPSPASGTCKGNAGSKNPCAVPPNVQAIPARLRSSGGTGRRADPGGYKRTRPGLSNASAYLPAVSMWSVRPLFHGAAAPADLTAETGVVGTSQASLSSDQALEREPRAPSGWVLQAGARTEQRSVPRAHTSKQNPQGRITSPPNTEPSSNNATNGSKGMPAGGAPFKPRTLVGGAQDSEPGGEIPYSTALPWHLRWTVRTVCALEGGPQEAVCSGLAAAHLPRSLFRAQEALNMKQ